MPGSQIVSEAVANAESVILEQRKKYAEQLFEKVPPIPPLVRHECAIRPPPLSPPTATAVGNHQRSHTHLAPVSIVYMVPRPSARPPARPHAGEHGGRRNEDAS